LDRKGLLLSKVYHTAGRQVELPNNGRIVVIHSLVIFLLRGEEGGGGVPGGRRGPWGGVYNRQLAGGF